MTREREGGCGWNWGGEGGGGSVGGFLRGLQPLLKGGVGNVDGGEVVGFEM